MNIFVSSVVFFYEQLWLIILLQTFFPKFSPEPLPSVVPIDPSSGANARRFPHTAPPKRTGRRDAYQRQPDTGERLLGRSDPDSNASNLEGKQPASGFRIVN
ncbi:unnamed protein product [Protopolystoma xenopodis]|uniref:Uncharacterized protein n=1 Tax=Protopolystoma xenopodis TaxID=117903 RepID=A0A448WR22_9PLAT|nr:unnamed protein product [Protopolystoma xenopodis]